MERMREQDNCTSHVLCHCCNAYLIRKCLTCYSFAHILPLYAPVPEPILCNFANLDQVDELCKNVDCASRIRQEWAFQLSTVLPAPASIIPDVTF